jgi:myo-inositol-1(or 4)-monophosphatase
MQTSGGDNLAGARVAGPKRVLERIAARGAGLVAMPRVHSLALRLVRVAQGELDAAIAGGNSADWDLAAADLLVHQAGGALTTFAGQTLVYNRADPFHGALVAAGRRRHEAFIALLREKALTFA